MALVLLCAPAGYGKTTLLAEWAQALVQHDVAVAWYALDPSDNDPIPFGPYLLASLTLALGPVPELAHASQLLRSSPEMDWQRVLPIIINAVAALDRDCVLIFDDYHVITTPAIHSGVAFLLEHLPANLHVVIGSRSDPPLGLARLRARRQLLELRAAALRFTAAEATAFLNDVMQLELTPDLVEQLKERTEGWVAGLQLAALSLAGRTDKAGFIASFTGGHRYLVEYLLEEVVRGQAQEIQTFLQATAILERLCGPLCDALLGATSGSAARLAQLEQTNLFVVALDDERYWYRYHHLFRDFLQTQLRATQPQRLAALHRTASEWYAAHGFLREAVQHAFQTADWEYAASVVEQHCFTLIIHSDIATIYEWCSAFPEAVMQTHPLLCLHQCWAWVFSFRRQNRSRIEARLKQVEQALAGLDNERLARELIEQATVIRSWLRMAPDPTLDPRAELALAQRTLDAYPADDPSRFSTLLTVGYIQLALHDAPAAQQAFEAARHIALHERLYFGIAESSFHLARLAHSQGKLRQAAAICRAAQSDLAALLPHSEQDLPAVGCLDIALGAVLLEQDQLAEAEQHLRRGLELIGWSLNPYYVFIACMTLFRLYVLLDRTTDTLTYLTRLEEMWPDIAFCTQGLRLNQTLRSTPQNPTVRVEAVAWCQAFSVSMNAWILPPGLGPFGAAEVYYVSFLAWLNTQMALGDAPATRAYLTQQLEWAEVHGLKTRVIELSLLDAQAARIEGDDHPARLALERALVAAQPEGFIRIFDQGMTLTHLLREAAEHGLFPEYIARLLAAIGRSHQSEAMPTVGVDQPSVSGSPLLESGERLSERELEVLQLMARGASNQAIADQLVISVGTVKSHINHILGKLEAHNRTEAVARAREWGLLEI